MRRNEKLFNKIADILEFESHKFDQSTWGAYAPSEDDVLTFNEMFYPITITSPANGYNATGGYDDGRWDDLPTPCGTKMCVAGWAAQLKGYKPSSKMITSQEPDGTEILRPRYDWHMVSKRKFRQARGWQQCRDVGEVAAELLGVTDEEAELLFHGDAEWTAFDLREFGRGESILDHEQYECMNSNDDDY